MEIIQYILVSILIKEKKKFQIKQDKTPETELKEINDLPDKEFKITGHNDAHRGQEENA